MSTLCPKCGSKNITKIFSFQENFVGYMDKNAYICIECKHNYSKQANVREIITKNKIENKIVKPKKLKKA